MGRLQGPSPRSPRAATSRSRHSGDQHLVRDHTPAAACRAPAPPPAQLPAALLRCSRHRVALPTSALKSSPWEGAQDGVGYACHSDTALHGVSIQPRKAAGPWLLAAMLAGWLPAGELAGSSAGLAHPWDQGHGSCWQPSPKPSAKQTVCRVAPHLGASQLPGSLSLPSSLEAAVHVPLILQQWHQ